METEYGFDPVEKGEKRLDLVTTLRSSYDSKMHTMASTVREKTLLDFLQELELERYYSNFKASGVKSLPVLLDYLKCNAEHILRTEFSIPKIGHRKRILLALEDSKLNFQLNA